MKGKRFAIGLVAGLLVGLSVVTASGGLGPAPLPFASFGPINHAAGGIVASTTATTSSSSVSQSRTASAGQALPVSSLNSTKNANLQGNLSTAQSATHPTPAFSSRLDSIAQQPLVSDAVILVPVLLAVLLGALLYRASLRDRQDSSEE